MKENVKVYTISDIEIELWGTKIGEKPLAKELVRCLGAEDVLKWYYHTCVPEFGNVPPHVYVFAHGKRGKERLAQEVYHILTGQPD